MPLSSSSIIWYCSKRGDLCGWEGLVSQWPCITDNSGIGGYGLKARERDVSTPSNAPWFAVNDFFLNFRMTWVSQHHNVKPFWVLLLQEMTDSETCENYLQLASVRLPRPAYQQRVFTGWMTFLQPNQGCQSTVRWQPRGNGFNPWLGHLEIFVYVIDVKILANSEGLQLSSLICDWWLLLVLNNNYIHP